MTPPIRIGFALTGSFCTHARALTALQTLIDRGCAVTPILSEATATMDTRFGTAADLRRQLSQRRQHLRHRLCQAEYPGRHGGKRHRLRKRRQCVCG